LSLNHKILACAFGALPGESCGRSASALVLRQLTPHGKSPRRRRRVVQSRFGSVTHLPVSSLVLFGERTGEKRRRRRGRVAERRCAFSNHLLSRLHSTPVLRSFHRRTAKVRSARSILERCASCSPTSKCQARCSQLEARDALERVWRTRSTGRLAKLR